jgi:ABC-type lipoprotein release transport system permease subunit
MGAARERDLALLGTVGLDRRQHLAITMIEQVPATLVATLVGGLTGMAIAAWLGPIIDLGPFIGPGLTADLQLDPIPLLATCLGMVVVVVTAVLIQDRQNRHPDLGQMVRMGDR